MRRGVVSIAVLPLLLGCPGALAGQEPAPETPTGTEPDLLPHEVIVVTPCRDCSASVVNSPAAVSVIPAASITSAPDPAFGELLRRVPGMHAVRTSQREHLVTSRQATSTLPNSGLVLVDGRSVYLDFLGVITWDMIPINPEDVEQIEVVRGPASAVWGANAFTGVVNIVTKPPRAAPVSALTLSGGRFDRDAGSTEGRGPGLTYGFRASLARVLGPTLAVRAAAGYTASDPLPRPTGRIPAAPHPLASEGTLGGNVLPEDRPGAGSFQNRGTTQPHADVRLDQELGWGRISYSAGIAGSDGIVHSGIGPFELERGSCFGYARAAYTRKRLSVGAFVNLVNAKAPNLLALDETGTPVRLDVETQSYDLSAGYSRPIGSRGILTFGGSARRNVFDITLAPDARDRTEIGAYAQHELFLGGDEGAQWRLALGARLDKYGNLGRLVASPRLSLMWKPRADHSVRLMVNRAFRAPSPVDNYLDQYFLRPFELPVELPGVPRTLLLPSRALGDPGLKQESLTAWEVGYIGTVNGRTMLGANYYLNDTRDNVNLTWLRPDEDPYTAEEPPKGWPLPPATIAALAEQGVFLPRTSSRFRNLGPIRHKGVELFVEHRFGDGVRGYANYTWQPDPRPLPAPEPFPLEEILIAPRNRVNGGIYWTGKRVMGSLGLSHADAAFWTDVLPHGYDGWSPPYTMFDASLGLRWAEGRIVTVLRGTNLTNAEVQQHVFGDIVKRSVWAELRFAF